MSTSQRKSLGKSRFLIASVTGASALAIAGWSSSASAKALTVPGTADNIPAAMPPTPCMTTWTFDTGADQTILSRACAMMLGLLDKNGNPVGMPATKGFNPIPKAKPADPQTYTYNTYVFPNVNVTATGTDGKACSAPTTVYVSQTNDSLGGKSLLGDPWQVTVNAMYGAKNKTATWMTPPPPAPAPKKEAVPKTDSKTGDIKQVETGVGFSSSGNTATSDMVVYSGADYSFIPQTVAAELGATPIGSVDLSSTDPDLLLDMGIGDMNGDGQTVFPEIQVDSSTLGIGPPGSVTDLLVNDNINSDFGIIGDNLLQGTDGVNGLLYVSDDGTGNSALYYTPVPEPASFSLLAIGGVSLLMRRKR
jgi:hypothetical protein